MVHSARGLQVFFKLSDARYHRLKLDIEALNERLDALKASHESLRSRYYATRSLPTGPPAPAPGSREEKDQILNQFLAGRVKHGS